MLRRTFLAGLAGLSMAAVASVPAKADQWVLLGQQTVGTSVDHDVFQVGGEEGRFNALRFRALGNGVNVGEVRVFYGNGSNEYLSVREHMSPGVFTRPVDLKGQDRVIRRIERISGEFQRRFSLPETADAANIKAKVANGVLEVSIPKLAQVQPQRILVEAA